MKNTNDKKPGYVQYCWLLFFMIFVLLGAMVQGCIPPPPRQAPKLPPPPGGPSAGIVSPSHTDGIISVTYQDKTIKYGKEG